MKTLMLVVVGVALTASLSAKTVAWYRFEEKDVGTATQSTVFSNSVNASLYPMYAGVCNNRDNQFDPKNLDYTADYMPYMTNGFPAGVALKHPQGNPYEMKNEGAVAVNIIGEDFRGNPHGQLFVDDDEALRLQTFTLEFFARIPKETVGFRCLLCRSGRKHDSACEAFKIDLTDAGVSGAGGRLSKVYFATVDDPLYDAQGNVTNQVKHSFECKDSWYNLPSTDDNKWHHFALVVDGVAKTVKFYWDYRQLGPTGEYTGDIYYEPGYPLAFGGSPQCTYYAIGAQYDEIRISDTALSSEEMLGYKRAGAGNAVDENTLFYFPFEGSMEPVTLGADDLHSPITYVPFLANQAVNPRYSNVDAEPYTKSGGSSVAPMTASSDVPAASVRLGLTGAENRANVSSVHVGTNSVDNDWADAIRIPASAVSRTELFSESTTVEFYFKAPSDWRGYPNMSGQGHVCCMSDNGFWIKFGDATMWNHSYFQVSIGGTVLTHSGFSGHDDYVNQYIADGKWHHAAVVYDKENARGEFYLDGNLKVWADGVQVPSTTTYYENTGFLLGGGYWGNTLSDFCFDELRISRGALRPYQFLTSRAVESSDLAYVAFDGDFVISPYADCFAAAVASAFTAEGVTPVIDRTRPGSIIREGKDGPVVKQKNRGAIRFAGGQLVYPDHGIVADQPDQTVQFFVKSSAAVAGAGLVRVNRDSKDALGSPSWAVSFADAAGNLALAVDTDAVTGQSHTFAASVADGAWHHVAITFQKVGSDTQATLYRDYVAVETYAFTGGMMRCFRETNLMLGAGDVATAGFDGWIDELRVTPGVLDPARFLWAESLGSMLILR